jgi:serine/threonine protein kinase
MIGHTISHYKILDTLGEGGMAIVYKAEDTKLKRTVALKFLSRKALGSEQARKRLFREAQAAGTLDHPNICTVHDIEEQEGQTYIVMTYVDGESLQQRIESGPLSLQDSSDIGIQIGQGLQAAHEMGIVHRDVKSGNVLITRKGVVKICDFGLALLADMSRLTPVGTALGTVSYMSPEQALSKKVDHRTDIWSLGVVLYEMLAGHRPFRGDNAQSVMRGILKQHPPPVSGLRPQAPADLDRVLAKALAKHAEERYQHVDDLLVDLRVLLKQLPPEARETPPQTPKQRRRPPSSSEATITLERPAPPP